MQKRAPGRAPSFNSTIYQSRLAIPPRPRIGLPPIFSRLQRHASLEPLELTRVLGDAAGATWSPNWWPLGGTSLFAICPEHARSFAQWGWDKERVRSEMFASARRAAAERQLALCESSDWFWWFGDYNPADAVSQFDSLYRRQLVVLYRMLGLPAPEALSQPISVGRGSPEHGGVMRRAYAT